ncbi:MAG: glycosyltransferase [Candidatus Kapaibacteriota bacterium]
MIESVKKDSIAVVVVTYNRLELLKKSVAKLFQQTKEFDKLIIVNNGSTDGTKEWLEKLLQKNDKLIVVSQENLGSSGGQYTGFKVAYEYGFEWIWEMDDDVSARENCLEELFNERQENLILSPLRYNSEGKVFFNEVKSYNLTNPFKSFWIEKISEKDLCKKQIPVEGITFEGSFFNRSLIEKIGLPEKHFFLYGDDTEYFLRARKAGFEINILTTAKLDRMLPDITQEKIHTQARYYYIRNIMLIDRLHGNLLVKFLRPAIYFVKWLLNSKSYSDIKFTIKAFKDFVFFKFDDGKIIVSNIRKNFHKN